MQGYTFAATLVLIASTKLFAQPMAPNFYTCAGRELGLEYRVGQDTEHHFRFQYRQKSVQVTGADRIKQERTEVGSLITIDTDYHPDVWNKTETLVLPTILLNTAKERVQFETVLISAVHYLSVDGTLTNRPYSKITVSLLKCIAAFQ